MTWLASPPARVRQLLWSAAGLMGLDTVLVVRRAPDYSAAGDSLAGALGLVLPGFALCAAGLVTWAKRPSSRSGRLLVAAGLSWFLLAWDNPAIGWAPAFTLGLVSWALCPAVVAHAVVTFPTGRAASRAERLAVASAYTNSVLVLGLLPTVVFDPVAAGCSLCPGNLLGVVHLPGAAEGVTRFGAGLGLVVFVALVVLVSGQLGPASPAMRRVKGPVSVPGAVYLALVAAGFAHELWRPVQGVDAWDRRLWLAQGTALLALAAGVGWGWFRAWRTRSEIARLVVDLAAAPSAGGLRDALAAMLGDPSLRLAYPLRNGELVDAQGLPLVDDRPPSILVRGDREVAVLTHRPGLLDDPATAEAVALAATIVLDNERLHAELTAQLAHLRASRQRIVAAGDAERRRLERDLHDGAQQGLAALLLQLRLLGSIGRGDAPPCALSRAREVEDELEHAVADLRELAQGIFPAVLADEGLAPAVDAYAEGAQVPVVIGALDDECGEGALDPTLQAVAYFVMAESIERSAAQQATVSITRTADVLCVAVDLEGVAGGEDAWLVGVADRVGAVDGRLDIAGAGTGRLALRAEIPCAS